jgi:hypothetical protein
VEINKLNRIVVLILVLLLPESCTSIPGVHEGLNEGVTVFAIPSLGEFSAVKMEKCLIRGISNANPDLQVMSGKNFRDALFPWFELGIMPQNPDDLAKLFRKPVVQKRIEELGIRYVVSLSGGTIVKEPEGGIGCGGGYGGAFCLGVITWDKETQFFSIIWDSKIQDYIGKIEETATGTSWFAAVFIFPIGLPSSPDRVACNDLGWKIAQVISGEQMQENQIIESTAETSEDSGSRYGFAP